MSDPFKLPSPGDKLPNSATLINAIIEGAREDSNADSKPNGSIPTSLEFFPHRVIFIRNTTQFQIPNDHPIPIGKPVGNTDVINGQVVFPIVSYVPGWATYARPLKRLPPGCAGPAVILGWLGPGRRVARYLYGQQFYRRTQPQRAYGGTTFTGLPYVQATHRDFPRPANSPWRQAWLGEWQRGISYSGDPTARFPKMESLGFTLPWDGETWIEFKHPVDQHGWWTPTLEFRVTRGTGNSQTSYFYPPANQTVTADLRGTFGRSDKHCIEPILWMPAVTGFNPTPQAYNGNFNHDPMVSGSTFNPNAGAPPANIFHTKSCPTHFSTKILWPETEEPFSIHRGFAGGGSSYYVFEAQGDWPNTWTIWTGVLPTVRLMPGTEVVQIFETDRDDARTFQGTVIVPGIGTGPGGPTPSGAGIVGPELQGPVGFSRLTATKANVSELVQPVSSATAFGSRLGSGATSTASATVSSGGTFV
jgi:hypothetical protein